MRRADRLFDIIQILRSRGVVKARDIAEKLEVSERTIYRDMSTLVAAGLPIDGEAGVGYMLRAGFDMPPLMFDEAEVEAVVLGLRIVRGWADPELREAAEAALAKVCAVLPEGLRALADEVPLDAPDNHYAVPPGIELSALRRAIKARRKIAFDYTDTKGRETHRVVCPLLVSFFGPIWTLTGWCELRHDFRMFRLDRVAQPKVLEATYPADLRRKLDRALAENGR